MAFKSSGTAFGGGYGPGVGKALGEGISNGLNFLVDSKLNKIKQSELSNLYQKSGMDADDANLAAFHAINNPSKFAQIFQGLENRPAISSLRDENKNENPDQNEPISSTQSQNINPNALQQLQLENLLGGLGVNQGQQKTDLGKPQDFRGILDYLQNGQTGQLNKTAGVGPLAPQDLTQKPVQQPKPQTRLTPEAAQQVLAQERTPWGTKKAQQKAQQEEKLRRELELKEEKASREEKKLALNETREFRNRLSNDTREAKDTIRDLDLMQENEKYLDTPGYLEFLKRSGLDIATLKNPESQEFEKIANNFVRNAKSIYGSRISNFEVEQFLKTVPSLSQSPEGRKRVIANLKYNANAKLAYNDTAREIIKENKGTPPIDLQEQVEERIDSKLDQLADKFKKDLAKPVPEGQNRLITALQAKAGDIAGNVSKLAKTAGGAYTGYKVGSKFGPYGGAIGGAIGGLGGLSGYL